MGLGLAALGRPAYVTGGRAGDLGANRTVGSMRARTHAMLDLAVAHEVQYLDAARSYGLAEEFLSTWLAGRRAREHLVVASKWGYTYVGDWRTDAEVHERKDHSLASFVRQSAESTDLLGDALSLYSIHSVTPQSRTLADRALLERLSRWSREHGIRLGLSTSGPQQAEVVRAALRVQVDGQQLFSAVQATWNVLEPSAGPALQLAHDAGLLVVVKEGLANGRLAGDEAPALLRAAADDAGTTPDALSLAVVLAQPWSPLVLSGAVTDVQLLSNLAARSVPTQTALATADALNALREEPNAYWDERSARPWA